MCNNSNTFLLSIITFLKFKNKENSGKIIEMEFYWNSNCENGRSRITGIASVDSKDSEGT